MRIRHTKIIIPVIISLLLIASFVIFLFYDGIFHFNNPSKTDYPIRGVDVSSYQGDIDWQVLSSEGISFAFIKATEGSAMVDNKFAYNYSEARKTKLKIGAYHFFSFDSSAETQADNFIAAVERFDGMLPPVIDLELYGEYMDTPPDKDHVNEQLNIMISRLEAHYGLKPILYVTEKTYDMYVAGGYENIDIWFRNVFSSPKLSDGREWTFWQFSNRHRLSGYDGIEKYIDMNVFCGTAEEFADYTENGRESILS